MPCLLRGFLGHGGRGDQGGGLAGPGAAVRRPLPGPAWPAWRAWRPPRVAGRGRLGRPSRSCPNAAWRSSGLAGLATRVRRGLLNLRPQTHWEWCLLRPGTEPSPPSGRARRQTASPRRVSLDERRAGCWSARPSLRASLDSAESVALPKQGYAPWPRPRRPATGPSRCRRHSTRRCDGRGRRRGGGGPGTRPPP